MLLNKPSIIILLSACWLCLSGCKDLQPALDTMNELSQAYQAPSNQETSSAIKQALDKGLVSAVKELGKTDGFSKTRYRIPLPDNIEKIANDARRFGLGSYVDSFENSMNTAAEKAVPEALNVFKSVLSQMTLTDVVGIMRGGDNSATNYFKENASSKLKSRFTPIVKTATDKVGVTQKYKKLTNKLSTYAGLIGTQAPDQTDLDSYITNKAIDALFDKVAEAEKNIRDNPLEQTSQLIRKVFNYYRN